MSEKYTAVCAYCGRNTTLWMLPNSENVTRCSYPCAKLFAVRVWKDKTTSAKIDWNQRLERQNAEMLAMLKRCRHRLTGVIEITDAKGNPVDLRGDISELIKKVEGE